MLLHEFDAEFTYPHIHFITHTFYLLVSPVFYLYGKSLMVKEYKPSITTIVHAIPFLIVFLGGFVFELLNVWELADIANPAAEGNIVYLSLSMYLGGLTQFFVYITMLFKKLRQFKEKYFETISSFEKKSIRWLQSLITIVVAIYVTEIFLGTLMSLDILTFNTYRMIMATEFTAFILYIGFVGLQQPYLYIGLIEDEKTDSQKQKQSQTGLTESVVKELYEGLEHLMSQKQPWLDQTLTLKKLADEFGVSAHQLSYVINNKTKSNFFYYINAYRIEAAKQRLLTETNLTILAIAEDSGFSSKTAFNAAFKKFTGTTPSQFRKAKA